VTFPERLAIASRNPGKIREILAICADWPVEWLTARNHPDRWPDVEETGETYLENASLKAEAVARALGVPAIADDSGIEVDALGGAPGMRSARFAGPAATDEENLAKLIDSIREVPAQERSARYRCVALLASSDGNVTSAEATCEGTLVTEPKGSGGFGYDPVFVADGETCTMSELSPEEKDLISHRGKAFRALRELIARD
jgi:XTP/dITP diphosphohydrolase